MFTERYKKKQKNTHAQKKTWNLQPPSPS